MGAYLSAPVTKKESFDEQCSEFNYGASSMQGWRTAQEDAHNCIPSFLKESNSSFFAVYDGHGGAEVAKYCELYFPEFVKKNLTAKSDEDLSKLIQTTFLEFDATLIEDDVVKKLKELAGGGDESEEEEDADDPLGRTETDMLMAEADMPLEELLAKYKNNPDIEAKAKKLFQSPALKPKAKKIEECSSSMSSETESAASSSGMSNGTTNEEEEGEACVSSTTGPGENGTGAGKAGGSSANESTSLNEAGGSGSGTESQAGSSGVESSSGQRASKIKAASDIAVAEGGVDSSDDDDDDDDDEEELDDDDDDSSEDDGEEEEEVEDIPLMDMTNEEPGSDSGCTACVLLKQANKLIVANAGDSRCVLSRSGVAVELSFDHKPEDDPERARIERAGGKVTIDGRVNGGLNLSRAIGDHVYKKNRDLPAEKQMITALPDIKTAELCSNDQFIVIACDGIWNFMTSQEVVDYVKEKLKDEENRKKPSLICEELFDHCLAPNILGDGTGCDNMTCIIIVLQPNTAPSSEADPVSVGNAKKRKASDEDTAENDASSSEVDQESLGKAKKQKASSEEVTAENDAPSSETDPDSVSEAKFQESKEDATDENAVDADADCEELATKNSDAESTE